MERPPSHVTDTLGEAQMRRIFEPLGWVVNKISGDYGIDFDVQIFEEHKATGEWFKVQLKSSESTAYSAKGDFISETLDIEHAAHYSTEIRDPVFLLHADLTNGRTFWFAPQLDAPVSKDDPRESITVRIDTRNDLPATLPEMVSTLRRIRIKLGARAVSQSPVSDFSKSVVDEGKQEELIKRFQDKVDSLRLHNIRELADAGKTEDANKKAENLIQSSESSIESKLSAVLEQERTDFMADRKARAPQSTTSQLRLRTSTRLRQLTRKGPPPFKFFALIATKAAELGILTFRDFGLYMNLVSHIREGDPAIALRLAIEQLQSTNQIVAKYNQCVRLAQSAANSPHRWALPLALLRVVESIAIFIMRLRIEGQIDAARQYRVSAMQLCRLAAWIAEKNRDDESLSYASTSAMLLAHDSQGKEELDDAVRLAREILAKITDRQQKEMAQEALDRAIQRLSGEKVEGDPDPDLVTQIIENRAWGIGIDMTDSENVLVKAIRLGIKDANPERAIRHCEHAFVSISGRVPFFITVLAQTLQLPSMQSKIIHCDLYDYAIEGRTLDSACEQFKKKYCESCKDLSPRPADWKYSDDWQQEENQKHAEFMKKFYQKRHR